MCVWAWFSLVRLDGCVGLGCVCLVVVRPVKYQGQIQIASIKAYMPPYSAVAGWTLCPERCETESLF